MPLPYFLGTQRLIYALMGPLLLQLPLLPGSTITRMFHPYFWGGGTHRPPCSHHHSPHRALPVLSSWGIFQHFSSFLQLVVTNDPRLVF